jgi:MYXO-CTERM domain-containing protein
MSAPHVSVDGCAISSTGRASNRTILLLLTPLLFGLLRTQRRW